MVYSWELKVALCVMEICIAKLRGEGRRAPGDKGTVPGKEPFSLLRSMDLILRVTVRRGRVACKEVSPLVWHFRKLPLAAGREGTGRGRPEAGRPVRRSPSSREELGKCQ